MSVYVVACSTGGLGMYLALDLHERLFTDWVIQIALHGPLIAALCWPLVRRQPRNGAIWALLWVAVLLSTQALATGCLQRDLAALGRSPELAGIVPTDLPGTTALLLQTASWGWVASNFSFVLALMLFPEGRLPSPRWRAPACGVVLGGVFATATMAWIGRPGSPVSPMSDDLLAELTPAGRVAMGTAMLLLAIGTLVGFAALVARYRASTEEGRLQLRWIAWAAGLLLVELLVLFPLMYGPRGSDLYRYTSVITFGVFIAAYVVAIARYRLHEIDRLISRTVSYGIVTALLAGVYAAVVLVAQVVLGPTGGEQPALVVAGSTLLVAALFGPVRHRAQRIVDRRFNRRVRDATDVVAAFGERLRDDVGLESLVEELRSASASVARPVTAGVWLLPSNEGTDAGFPPRSGRTHLSGGRGRG
jgi:hypothetical protein